MMTQTQSAPDDRRGQHGPGHGEQTAVDSNEVPADFWERRYSEGGRVWSGRVNSALADAVADLPPGRALDLGCGEGGDVLWLAERGWEATGIDLSPTAIERGRATAVERGLPAERVRFVAADLAEWVDRPSEIDGSHEPFDLVTASFLQSPVALPRERILRAAAARLAPGGRLVLVSHAAGPDGSSMPRPGHGPSSFPSPESELRDLALDSAADSAEWEIVVAEVREREAHGHPSGAHSLLDTVVVVRRAAR